LQLPHSDSRLAGREAVLISKRYDIVAPASGEIRQHCHSRKGFAISEDCRTPEFSDAVVSLRPPVHERRPEAELDIAESSLLLSKEVVCRGMQLIDIVAAEADAGKDYLDSEWRPALPDMPNCRGVRRGSVLSWLLGGGDELAKIQELCHEAQRVLQCQPVVSEVHAPAKVFGDIHGQFRDLLLLFHFYGRPGAGTDTAADEPPTDSVHRARTLLARSGFAKSRSSSGSRLFARTSTARESYQAKRPRSFSSVVRSRAWPLNPDFSSTHGGQSPSTASSTSAASAPVRVSFVFNGDWVDRGHHQLEVVVLLFALKILFPTQIWLIKGNHEDKQQNAKTSFKQLIGFDSACLRQFGERSRAEIAFNSFHECFDWLPLAARIGGRILVLHGGLGSGEWTLDMLRSVERPFRLGEGDLTTTVGTMVYNALWSDPLDPDRKHPVQTFGVHGSSRSKHSTVMKTFGRDVTERFCEREGIDLIVRSHQFKQWGKGYELMHDGLLMRVFSARNYCGVAYNDGGILLIGYAHDSPGTLVVRPQNVERMALPQPPRFGGCTSGLMADPYCPRHHLMKIVKPRPVPGCLSLAFVFRHEADDNVECNICGAEELELGCYWTCHGCNNYDVCLECANKSAIKGHVHVGQELPIVDSDSDAESTPTSVSVPTLLTTRAAAAVAKSSTETEAQKPSAEQAAS